MPVPAPGQTRSSHSPVPQFVGGGGVGGAPVFDVEEEEEGDEEGSYYDEDDDFLAADESGIPHHDAGMPGASQVYPPGYPPVQQPPVGPYGQPQYPGPNHYQDPYLQSDDRSYNGSMYPPGPVPGPMGSAYNMDQIMNDPMYPPTMVSSSFWLHVCFCLNACCLLMVAESLWRPRLWSSYSSPTCIWCWRRRK